MVHFADTENDDKFIILEKKATEIRKILLGALLLAKDIWKDELEQEQEQEGIEIIETIEKAEEAFVNTSLIDELAKLENILSVIHKRANVIFTVLEYISKNRKK